MVGPGIGIAIWGFVTGVAMVESGLSTTWAIVMSLVVFAGSAQLASLPLIAAHSPLPVVWMTALLVNLRFVIFSAASRKYFAPWPARRRLLAAYLNGDIGFVLLVRRFATATEFGTDEQLGYFAGTAGLNWFVWQGSSIIGIVAGGYAPERWGLDLAAVLALVAVLVPMIVHRPVIVGVVVTGLTAVLTIGWPYRLGLVVSIVAGVVLALVIEQFVEPTPVESKAG